MSVASKNAYALLGNDDGDSDNAAPVKTVDKNNTRTVKRNTDGEAPATKGTGAPVRRGGGGATGNDGAFRDRAAGSDRNRVKSTDDAGGRGGFRGGRGARVRGGPGARFPRDRDDRHTKGGPGGGSDKQAAQGWGAVEGEAEMKDEQAGEEIAKKDEKDAATEDAEAREEYPPEPEDKSVSYADYLAEQAEKKQALDNDNALKVRKPNEGSKQNKQWAAAKPLAKDDDDEFISGSGGKVKRERERKTKQLVEIDNRYVEPERTRGGGGGRGGSRGGRGESSSRGGPRGEGRGGDRGGRGGGPRGEYRGGRGGGDRGGRGDRSENRGDYRGGRGGGRGGAQGLNTNDETAFPTLGS